MFRVAELMELVRYTTIRGLLKLVRNWGKKVELMHGNVDTVIGSHARPVIRQ